MITKDKYVENADGGFDCTLYGVWQIAYMRYKGYDFDTCQVEIVENSEKNSEKGFRFCDVDENFDKILNSYHQHDPLPIVLEDYRKIFLNTKNILTGKA